MVFRLNSLDLVEKNEIDICMNRDCSINMNSAVDNLIKTLPTNVQSELYEVYKLYLQKDKHVEFLNRINIIERKYNITNLLEKFYSIELGDYNIEKSKMECSICNNNVTDIIQVRPCGCKSFCVSCADKWFNQSNKCPNCRQEINYFDTEISACMSNAKTDISMKQWETVVHVLNCTDDNCTYGFKQYGIYCYSSKKTIKDFHEHAKNCLENNCVACDQSKYFKKLEAKKTQTQPILQTNWKQFSVKTYRNL